MNAFNPSFDSLKSNLKNMLLKGINSFEDGFEILDIDLEMDEHYSLDVLAKDSKGNPTVVLMADAGEENLINRILNTLCQLRKFRFLLQRIYKSQGFDFSVPPRILLLSSRFSDDFIEKLDFIVAGEVVPYEYSVLKVDDKEFLTFSRRDIDEGGAISAYQVDKMKETPSTTDNELVEIKPEEAEAMITKKPAEVTKAVPTKKAEDLSKKKKKSEGALADRFFHDAKKKILRISNDIVEVVEAPYSRFKISNRVLVTLSKENDVFSIYLGDTSDKSMKIQSEEQLNEALNQIFKRYFTAFSNIAKT